MSIFHFLTPGTSSILIPLPKRPLVYVLGDITREICLRLHSFPKPGREHHVDTVEWRLGGSAFNTAAALVRLRVPSGVIGRVGKDKEGLAALREMAKMGIKTGAVQKDPDRPTGFRVIPVTTDGQHTRLEARGANTGLALDAVREALQNMRHLHVSGTSLLEPGMRRVASEALRLAREKGATTSLDVTWPAAVGASESIREVLPGVSVTLAGAPELRMSMGIRKLSDAAREALGLGVAHVVATLGGGGCRVFAEGKSSRVPPFETRQSPAQGVGDSFSAGYVLGLVEGAEPLVCAVLANAADALAVHSEHPYLDLDRLKLVSVLHKAESGAAHRGLGEAVRQAIQRLSKSPAGAKVRRRSRSAKRSSSLPASPTLK